MKVFDSLEYANCWQEFVEDLASLLKKEGVTYLDITTAIYWSIDAFEYKIKERKGVENK